MGSRDHGIPTSEPEGFGWIFMVTKMRMLTRYNLGKMIDFDGRHLRIWMGNLNESKMGFDGDRCYVWKISSETTIRKELVDTLWGPRANL